MKRHPSLELLARSASADLGWLDRARIHIHARVCGRCREEIDRFRQARAETALIASEMPSGVQWDALAAEMTANIRLGLAAGECVAPARSDASAGFFRPVAAVATVAAVMMSVTWWSFSGNRAANVTQELASRNAVLEATEQGLAVQANGAALTLIPEPNTSASLSVGAGGSLRKSYIDEDTGQVTIHHVYAE